MESRRGYAFYALGVIFFANFLNYLDRTVVSTLEKPLRASFNMTGAEFGLLWTLFTLGYMLFAPFIGFFTDRYRRTRLLSLCILVWSLATIGSGLAPTKFLLYVSRILIGVGEAGCLIIGPTLISDYFPKHQRGRALSIFFLGLPLGGTAGYVIGGTFAAHEYWRNAFYFAGLPGLALAVVVWILHDPPRGAVEGVEESVKIKGFKPYLELLKTPTLFLIILAQAFAVLFLVPLLHFGSGFFQEFRGMDANEASRTLGLMALVGGGIGSILSGILGDKLSKRYKGAYAFMAGVAFIIGLPCLLGGLYITTKWIYLGLLCMVCLFYFLCMPAVNTQIANVTHPSKRAMAYALAVFVLHLLGDTMAPPIFGKVSDSLTRRHDPVEVNRVRLVVPAPSGADGQVARFKIQFKPYDPDHRDASHGQEGSDEKWSDVIVRATNAFPWGSSGWYATRERETFFEFETIRSTRLRFLQDVRSGAAGHPAEARLLELQVFAGAAPRPAIRAEVDSGAESWKLVDGDDSSGWQSAASDERHFANIVFGAPGTGRRLAFFGFSFSLLLAGGACLLAARTARKDMERIADAITQVRKETPPGESR